MHIPEGYLGPQTYGAAYVLMAPIWTIAGRMIRRTLSSRKAPLLAVGAAFSFVIMMFNVPIPFGASGHATGASLLAILLGPWAAVLLLSVVLVVQALLFGDGGLTVFAANCFNMAFVMPMASYVVYHLFAGKSEARSVRRFLSVGVSAYLGLNAAAFTTAVMFGLQPTLAHASDGRPLFCPYGLNIAVPVMMAGHLLVFGWVEAIITMLAIGYLTVIEPSLFIEQRAAAPISGRWPRLRRLWFPILILALLTPLGIWLPNYLRSGEAWGEWAPEEIGRQIGFIPRGLERLSELWKAPLPDYGLPGLGVHQAIVYVTCAFLGVVACMFVMWVISRKLAGQPHPPTPSPHAERGSKISVLPTWLAEPVSSRPSRSRLLSRYLGRALRHSARLVTETVLSEQIARHPGFLQSLDARAKLWSMAVLLIAATFLHHILSLLVLGSFVVVAALFSRISGRVLFHRAWWTLPVAFAVIALPASLNIVVPGRSFITISHVPELAITQQGLASMALLITRLFIGVLLTLTLTFTTRSQDLLKAAHIVVTAPFVFILTITHRYIFVLLRSFEETHFAKQARTICAESASRQRRWIGNRIAALFLRSHRLSELVHMSMVARGYRGIPKSLLVGHMGVREIGWLAACAVLIVTLIICDRLFFGGLSW